jgi:hypothetical protein
MRIAKTLLTLALLTFATGLQAARINFEVQVPGYSSAGWIKVLPELRSRLGGRVAYLPQYGGWVTDRVSRGEVLRTTITADRLAERSSRGAIVGVDSSNGFIRFTGARLTYSRTQRVSLDTSFDNVYVWSFTEAGYFEQRVPIGRR